MRRGATALVVLAGCGGVTADQRAAERSWSAMAEDKCEQSAAFVASAQQPSTIDGLERYATDVAGYMRDGIAEIQRIPVPEGAEARATTVLGVLRGTEPQLRALEYSSRLGDRRAQVAAAKRLRDRWREIQGAVRTAGLRSCFDAKQGGIVADSVLAPIWVQRFAELQTDAGRQFLKGGRVTNDRIPAALRRAARITDRLARRIQALEPPDSIDDTYYVRLLGRVSAAERALAGRVADHDAAGARIAQRELGAAVRRQATEVDRLGFGTGHFAVPVAPKGSLAS
jgi:hypothetical protein